MDQKLIDRNIRVATEFYRTYECLKDSKKVRDYIGASYRQHNPYVSDDIDGFCRFVQYRHDNFPQGRNIIKMTIADEEKVLFHVHSVLVPGQPGRNLVDTFKVEDGKIVEHWDAIENVVVTNFAPLNDWGLFNELGQAILCDIDKTEENKKIAFDFYNACFVDKDSKAVSKMVSDDYMEHNTHILPGKKEFLRFVDFRKDKYPEGKNEIKVSVCQGNLIGFHVHEQLVPGELGRNLVDMYRIEDGLIAEHWCVHMPIDQLIYPPLTDNGYW